MQHHPGSWYMPWGVPLQKMLAVPLHHPSVATVGYHQSQAAAAVQVAGGPNAQQPTHHQTYQQHQLHPALHQQLHHPGAAAAMFTPLSLRTFISQTPNHMSLGQQALTNVAAVVAAQHQQNSTPSSQTSQQTSHLHQNAQSHHQTHSHAHAHSHSTAQMQHSAAVSMQSHSNQSPLGAAINLNVGCVPLRQNSVGNMSNAGAMMIPVQKVSFPQGLFMLPSHRESLAAAKHFVSTFSNCDKWMISFRSDANQLIYSNDTNEPKIPILNEAA